jgi:hypothetical protein
MFFNELGLSAENHSIVVPRIISGWNSTPARDSDGPNVHHGLSLIFTIAYLITEKFNVLPVLK